MSNNSKLSEVIEIQVPKSKPIPRVVFPRVKEAREALREKALEIFQAYYSIALDAHAKGDSKAALEALRWLMEHMPRTDDGDSIVDSSAAKPVQTEGQSGPIIQIGFKLGGVNEPKLLPESSQEKDE